MNKIISDIIYRLLSGETIQPHEQVTLEQWLSRSAAHREMYDRLQTNHGLKQELITMHSAAQRTENALEQFAEKYFSVEAPVYEMPERRKTNWFKYAAAIIILFGIGTYIYINNQKEKPSVSQNNNPVPVQNDVAPGGNRATLTLADGSVINLDSAANGTLARDGSATIFKKADGQIVYSLATQLPASAGGSKSSLVSYNTMATPRGGQYELTLPDGSQVWLNAESSITYPTAFSGKERKVTITGEAYFEVAKDKTKKFLVNVDNKQEIEVIGTHFNVNAYKEEPTINTTLLEGSVRLTAASAKASAKAEKTVLTLKPGQQGQLTENKLSLAANPDVEQVMAWKNGMFLMSNTDLPAIMRQVTRWYDIDVIYETKPSNEKFFGGISRNLPLSGILDLLKNAGVKFRLDGRKLYVRP